MELSVLKYFLSSGDIVVQWNAWMSETEASKKKEKETKAFLQLPTRPVCLCRLRRGAFGGPAGPKQTL